MKYFGGVDVGVTGGWAIVDEEGIPVFTSKFIGWREVIEVLAPYKQSLDILFAVELVHSMPKQGVKSMFTFGKNAGGWEAMMIALDIPHIMVSPGKWQRAVLGSFPKGQSKVRALDFAKRRWPSMNLVKTNHGVVDALCLSEYVRLVNK